MAESSKDETSTATDTDSSVIFVGVSQNIKVQADVHKEDMQLEGVVPETPPKNQPKKKTILKNFSVPSVPETDQSGI